MSLDATWIFFAKTFGPAFFGALTSILLVVYWEKYRFCVRRQKDAIALLEEIEGENGLIKVLDSRIVEYEETGNDQRSLNPARDFSLWEEKRLDTIYTLGPEFFHSVDDVANYVFHKKVTENTVQAIKKRKIILENARDYLRQFQEKYLWLQALGLCPKNVRFDASKKGTPENISL